MWFTNQATKLKGLKHIPLYRFYEGQKEEFKGKIDQKSAKACFNKEDEKTKEHAQKGAEKAYQQWKTAYEKTLNNDSLLKEDQVDG
ncbi:hypothetical protein Moror_15572 [Moniliophthora roreri MCA 2997]|uniref:Uncharacterized protein n=1 Tax=Moniliophthora roreri (strain MCA 2997) TaxID=1381753 RepID=V2W9G8_MONRO|nr:hypothetical protein Moror_15572 [Moniliophthora roreri MCA 2997]